MSPWILPLKGDWRRPTAQQSEQVLDLTSLASPSTSLSGGASDTAQPRQETRMVTQRSWQCAFVDTALGRAVLFYFCLAWAVALHSQVHVCYSCTCTQVHLQLIQGLLLILARLLLPEPWLSSLAWTAEPILRISESLFWSI